MKLDHFVLHVDKAIQQDPAVIEDIRQKGLPYEPNWGKGTKGFKASNLWIGHEYLELVHLLKPDGGGWKPDWVQRANKGERGLVCLMLDVDDLDKAYADLTAKGIAVTPPQWLEFKWGFGLFTRRMPWRNCYLPYFEGAPFQLGLQQMKDEKARTFMEQYMVPNARDNGISGIQRAQITAAFTPADHALLQAVLGDGLVDGQSLTFAQGDAFQADLYTDAGKDTLVHIQNVTLHL